MPLAFTELAIIPAGQPFKEASDSLTGGYCGDKFSFNKRSQRRSKSTLTASISLAAFNAKSSKDDMTALRAQPIDITLDLLRIGSCGIATQCPSSQGRALEAKQSTDDQ